MKKKKSDFESITIMLCSLIMIIPWQSEAAGGVVKRVLDKTKYVDQYFEIDQNGDFKVHIYIDNQKIVTTDNEGLYLPVNDHLGSHSIFTDQSGQVAETNDYDDYGKVVHNASSIDNGYKFTGKELDGATGLQYFGQRYYDNNIGKFYSIDPLLLEGSYRLLADPQKLNSYSYVYNNPVKYIDPIGESGELTVHANGGSIRSGHAWVSFIPDDTYETVTYGTWGNNPDGRGNGLLKNQELNLGMMSEASRTMEINDTQEQSFFSLIDHYESMGEEAWKLLAPCSAFAQDAWQAGTGEFLNANTFIINNPQELKTSIISANGGYSHSTVEASVNNNTYSSSDNTLGKMVAKMSSFFHNTKDRFYISLRHMGEYANSLIQPIFIK